MGRFEDLIEQAKTGDLEAIDALEAEFSGSTLREKAEKAEALEKELQKVRPLQRQQRFDDLVSKLDENLRSAISLADVDSVEPETLSLEMLQDLATSKAEQKQAARLAIAQDAGFDTVDEYEDALEAVKQQAAQRRNQMESVGKGVASSSGEIGEEVTESLADVGKKAFDSAKKEGSTDDLAMAIGIESILNAQFEGGE